MRGLYLTKVVYNSLVSGTPSWHSAAMEYPTARVSAIFSSPDSRLAGWSLVVVEATDLTPISQDARCFLITSGFLDTALSSQDVRRLNTILTKLGIDPSTILGAVTTRDVIVRLGGPLVPGFDVTAFAGASN